MATLVYEDFPGTSTTYPVNFEYLSPDDIYVGYITEEEDLTLITEGWSLTDATTITFDSAPGGTIRIFRVTPVDEPVAVFYPTVAIRAVDLNNNFDQCLMRLQEINSELETIYEDIDLIEDELQDLNEAITELSGITILPDVPSLNAYTPSEGEESSAIQVSNSTDWSDAEDVSGTPPGFTGGPTIRVNLRIVTVDPKSYAFISYTPIDPDSRYVERSGSTMTGALILSENPTENFQASTKEYVDNAIADIPSDVNTTYDFGAATDGTNAQLQLVGNDGTTDVVTVSPGSNITITGQSATGFTINAAGSAIPGTGNVTIAAGTNMSGGGSFNVNQSSDTTITLNSTGSGSTNLSWRDVTPTSGTVDSDTGTNATITAATTSLAGLMSATDKTTLDNVASVYLVKDFSTLPLLPE